MRAETVICTHAGTDFDALASQLAARRLYPGAVVALQSTLARNVRAFARLYADELALVEVGTLELDAIERLVLVETADPGRLGELEAIARDPAIETFVFDHHRDSPDWVAPEHVYLSKEGALTTTLVGILAEREVEVTASEATAFALGIHEDTGSLTFASATQRDAEALAWCMRHGARTEDISQFLRPALGDEERELLAALLAASEPVRTGGVELLVTGVRWPREVEGVSLLAHKLVDLTDCDALACLVEMDNRVLGVFRSRVPELDAGTLAAALGGGGHRGAASASARIGLTEALETVRRALEGAVAPSQLARDIMSRPARAVDPETSVAKAMAACQRYRQSGMLIVDKGGLRGAVSREDLDKALGHDLDAAPVKGIMTPNVAVCAPETPLPALRRLLLEAPTGRVAVVEGGKVAGVVTRGDLLKVMGAVAEEAGRAPGLGKKLVRIERLSRIQEAIAPLGGAYDGIYLVGGSVRDMLLGAKSFDVDIAVEGDAIALARDLARLLAGRVRVHEKFGTAVVLYDEGERLDVVTTRTEFYDAPAALPTVEHATIREDLFRRDFTINAMAVSLRADDFGRLVDPFGGRADLDDRRLRILHNLSFVDDPTRIFRAVRYESRLGFRMDEHTLALARSCLEMGLIGDLSSTRLREELIGILDEDDAPTSIVRLAEIGAAAAIHPRLAVDEEAAALLSRAFVIRDDLAPELPRWRIGLAVLGRRMAPAELYSWLERLRLRRRDIELIAAAVAFAPKLVERAAQPDVTPAAIVSLAERSAPDGPVLALAERELPPLVDYLTRLRRVRLEVTGSDLAELGLRESPRVGEILEELRRRKLNGELEGRESELAAAQELIAAS